ncbi:ABC transporter permease [Desulfosporosinus sp. PR]|uniref:ABC transporter permease n=1 Tax=Candidatus Desulfosporosinus nitrosoreducens TaxID=3401928 RepID=UPI0027F9A9CA|nr:ABC transporter permease [Desulfosporosinus sp. PR]MDQ7095346.1 ABC transporter permease [Desulfosporosinus sp. PR]
MWSLVRKEFKLRLKERKTYIFMFLMPIIIILLIGSTAKSNNYVFDIHYTDLDKSPASQQILQSFQAVKGFKLTSESDVNNALAQVKSNKQPVYFVIPQGFQQDILAGKQPVIDVHYDPNSTTSQGFLSALDSVSQSSQQAQIENYVQSTAGNNAAAILKRPFLIKKEQINVSQNTGIAQILPGYTVMFAFFIITIMAQSFFKDRESGMLARLMGTPLRKYEYMMGMWIPNFIVVLIQVAVLYTFGLTYFKMSLGNIPALVLVTLLLAFVATALGLLLTFISQNQQMVLFLVQLTVMGGAALGGLWFPIDILPSGVRKISVLFPQYWIQKSYVSIFGQGGTLGDIGFNITILLIMGAVFSLLAYFRYNRFYDQAIS